MSAPYWASDDGDVVLHLGDCLNVLRTMEADSVDAIVTDPPAGIAFMGRDWDDFCRARSRFVDMLTERMAEAYRVLKPGGHALVWAIPRTSHWTAWAIEDAGFDLRDCVLHLFGSGFPKSLDVSKAIDKAAGAERAVVGKSNRHIAAGEAAASNVYAQDDWTQANGRMGEFITAPATDDAARWSGWGTALKPGQEIWWLARKPLKGTVAANVLEFGTGALNIAACKVGTTRDVPASLSTRPNDGRTYGKLNGGQPQDLDPNVGRWPANIVFTHSAACEPLGVREVRSDGHHPATRGSGGLGTSGHGGQDGLAERKSGTEAVTAWACAPDCPVGELDRQSGVLTSGANPTRRGSDKFRDAYGDFTGQAECIPHRGTDSGGASRFYPAFRYQAKAPASERPRLDDGTAHETVKSLGLMSWLVRLITPPGGTVLDMFAGSGPVGEVCVIEGFRCVLIEKDPSSAELIKTRLAKPIQPAMFGLEAS